MELFMAEYIESADMIGVQAGTYMLAPGDTKTNRD